MISEGDTKDKYAIKPLNGVITNTLRSCCLNSALGSFRVLLSIPNAQLAMTSVVNFAVTSFISTAEAENIFKLMLYNCILSPIVTGISYILSIIIV